MLGNRTNRGIAASLVIAMVATLAFSAFPAAAGVTSPNVVAFSASPTLINVNRTASVTLEIGASAGVGADNYLVSVFSPAGNLVASAWYNFTAVGPMSKVIGNASADFALAVTQVGVYTLKAAWWNASSSAFEPAADAPLQVTDMLFVTTEFAAGSDDWMDVHNCEISEEFQRGDGIIARGYVHYASTGEYVNTSYEPTAAGNVTGTLMGTTKVLNYNSKFFFFRAAWQLPWDAPIGVFQFVVNASDGLGNHGSAVSPAAGYYGSLKVTPSVLTTTVWTQNATTGLPVTAFYPGETVQVAVRALYDGHHNHNYAYTNTDAVNKSNTYRLGPDRGGAVTASIGTGAFNATSKTFASQLASPTFAFDAASGNWLGTWTVPAAGPFLGNVTIKAFATDGAPTPNGGAATETFSTLPLPEPQVVTNTVYQNQTIYQNRTVNQTVEVAPPGSMDATVAYGLAGVAIVAGAAAGFVLASRRRGGKAGPAKGSAPAAASKKDADKELKGEEKKKGDQGWD